MAIAFDAVTESAPEKHVPRAANPGEFGGNVAIVGRDGSRVGDQLIPRDPGVALAVADPEALPELVVF